MSTGHELHQIVQELAGAQGFGVSSDMVEALEESGFAFYSGEEDLELATVYNNRPYCRAHIVIPGERTLEQFPEAQKYGVHFRKTYARPDAPPLARGESPQVEFEKTSMLWDMGFHKIAEPLGAEPMVYRARVLPGRAMQYASPFAQHPYEVSLASNPCPTLVSSYASRLIDLCQQFSEIHNAGLVHGDAHDDQFLINLAAEKSFIIDWASLEPSSDPDAFADDFTELYRDLAFCQAFIGNIGHPAADQALLSAHDLLPEPIASQIQARVDDIGPAPDLDWYADFDL